MPTIVFASPKGGVGKTTAAVILGTQLAAKGVGVSIIDADPRRRISRWASKGNPGLPSLHIASQVTEDSVIDAIETAAAADPFVLVDLEGTASMMVGYAISRADLVIIPAQGSQMDAEEAVTAIKLVKQQERAFRRRIPYAVLLTRTSAAIRPRTLRHVIAELDAAAVPRMKVELIERDAFRALFSFGGTLENLDRKQVSGVPDAIKNAKAFAAEVVELIKAGVE